MIDVLYLAGTVAFFAAMLAYVAGCQRLGNPAAAAHGVADSRP